MISSGYKDWEENPILMTVDTFDVPIEEIEFPAITLCPSPTLQPDNWALTEQVFNSFKFNCVPKEGKSDFLKVLDRIYS